MDLRSLVHSSGWNSLRELVASFEDTLNKQILSADNWGRFNRVAGTIEGLNLLTQALDSIYAQERNEPNEPSINHGDDPIRTGSRSSSADQPNSGRIPTGTFPPEQELTPAAPSIDPPVPDPRDALIQQQMAVINELRQSVTEINQKLDNPTAPIEPVVPPKSKEERDKEFWDNPTDMIRKELADAVKPMQDFITQQKGDTDYDKLKAKFKMDVRFAKTFELCENYIDQLMANQPPIEGAMLAVLYGVKGAIVSGDIPGVSFDTPIPPQPVPVQPVQPGVDPSMMPAHLRPSAPPTQPGNQPPVARREMNENERRLMRESGMTAEQWWTLQELPADKVATHQLTQPGA